jgi:RNA polymerase sigma-70 factor (ECF subfamily)
LRRLGVPIAQLDDATQEVFWVAARRLSDIEHGSEHPFLYGVALRIASNELRRMKSAMQIAELELVHTIVHDGPSPEEHLEQRQARELLDEVLVQLPLELRTVFVLFELEGMEVRQIAELQAIPLGTAGSRLRRAREEFSAITRRVRARLHTAGGHSYCRRYTVECKAIPSSSAASLSQRSRMRRPMTHNKLGRASPE